MEAHPEGSGRRPGAAGRRLDRKPLDPEERDRLALLAGEAAKRLLELGFRWPSLSAGRSGGAATSTSRLAHAVPLGVRGDDVPGNGEQPRLERPVRHRSRVARDGWP